MNLKIDRLDLQLPASLGARRHSILQQLRGELMRLQWPSGQWSSLALDQVVVSPRHTNIRIARQIAQQLHRAALLHSQGRVSAHAQGEQP